MRYPRHFKLMNAASKPELSRFAMEHAKFDGKSLIATTGRILAKVPVLDCDGDAEGMIDGDAIRLAQKGGKGGETLLANLEGVTKVWTKDNVVTEFKTPEGNFPAHEEAIPKRSKGELSVMIDGDLLKLLIDAIGGGWIRFQFTEIDGKISQVMPIRLDSHGNPGAIGVIMPVEAK